MRNKAPVSSNHFLLSQLRQFRKADSKLTEEKSCKGAEDDSPETIEDAGVVLLRLHDVDGLRRNVVVCVFGHDCSLLGLFFEVEA